MSWVVQPGPKRMMHGSVQAESGQSASSHQDGEEWQGKGMQFSDKDEHIYFWFPLLAGLSELTFDPRSELRHSALGVRPCIVSLSLPLQHSRGSSPFHVAALSCGVCIGSWTVTFLHGPFCIADSCCSTCNTWRAVLRTCRLWHAGAL